MHKQRLVTLAAFLDTVTPEQFDLDLWRCGTVACAVGHACTLPEFQALGLLFDSTFPTYKGESGWDAVTSFFDLSFDDATWLFNSIGYDLEVVPPEAVSSRIRSFVNGT